jgi:hypothetical protein
MTGFVRGCPIAADTRTFESGLDTTLDVARISLAPCR